MSDSPRKTPDFRHFKLFHACLNRALAPGFGLRLTGGRCASLAPQRL